MRSDAARNRDRILEAARELIGRDGPSVSMDAIAEAAGVAVGTLYRHHPTKAALVDAVVRQSIDQISLEAIAARDRVEAGADVGDELADLFRFVAARHATDMAVKQAAQTLGAYEPPTVEDLESAAFAPGSTELAAWDAINDLLTRAKRSGEVRGDLGAADLMALLAGVPGSDVPADVRDRYIDIVLAGMRPSTTG